MHAELNLAHYHLALGKCKQTTLMLRHCMISLLAVGPLALLQLVAWLGMALQADLSTATTGDGIIAAVSAKLSTPCQLCDSVQATQAEQEDEAATNDRRVDQQPVRTRPSCVLASLVLRGKSLSPAAHGAICLATAPSHRRPDTRHRPSAACSVIDCSSH